MEFEGTCTSSLDLLHRRGEYAVRPTPDLILLESRLPGKDGPEVVTELKNDPVSSEIPIVMLTVSDFGEEFVKSHGVGADYYIQKPVDPKLFVTFVIEIKDFWHSTVTQNDIFA